MFASKHLQACAQHRIYAGLLLACVSLATISCGGNFLGSGGGFGGDGGDSGGSGNFRGGDPSSGNQNSNNSANNSANNSSLGPGGNNANNNGQNNSGWPNGAQPGFRGDVDVDYGQDDPNLYAPATVAYNGDYSGKDALFTFYIQRRYPAPEKVMRELIRAQGEKISDQKTLEKVCRCGRTTEFYFFWEHKHGRKGALHSKVYDQDNRLQGDWLVSNQAGDSAWYKGNLTSIPQGKASMFFGADTENPTAMLGMNAEGNGYLRTWYYMPNSLPMFATKEHRWDSRDDMRIGMTCDVSSCPESQKEGTEIKIIHHFSHAAAWKLP